MLLSLISNPKSANHRKSQSSLPSLSLGQLQKNYYALKQQKGKFNKQNKFTKYTEKDIVVSSPFYDRTNCTNKTNCKCQFHKKRKAQIQKISFNKTKHNKLQSIDRLQTVGNQQINKFNQTNCVNHKRFKSLMDQNNNQRRKSQQYFKNLIANNQQLYQQFLKKLQLQKKSDLDCYNHEFQQFLKSKDQWILHDTKHKNSFLKSNTSVDLNNKNRYKTAPSNFGDSQYESYAGSNHKDKYLKLNGDQFKKNIRRKNKKFTDFSFASDDDEPPRTKSCKFLSCFDSLKAQDRTKLQAFLQSAFKDIGLNYSDLKSQNIQDANFFGTICKQLLDPDQNVVEKAKNVLKRISRLPLNLYSTLLKQMKVQVQNFSNISQNNMQKSINMAFETIQNSVQMMIKNKQQVKGRQKLSLLSKLRNKLGGRGSLNLLSSFSTNKKNLRLSGSLQSTSRQKEFNQTKRSRFAYDKFGNIIASTIFCLQSNQLEELEEKNQIKKQITEKRLKSNRKFEQKVEYVQKQKIKEVKKGVNFKRMKTNEDIMKSIDQQIQSDHKKMLLKRTNSQADDDNYLKERAQSRKRIRDQELRKHLQFLRLMKEKQIERQSSTMSECQMKKNNTRAHYQRHRVFLKKMQISLTNNQQLKEVVINYQDDLFTKKRKVRILKKMIQQHPDQQSQFCSDIKKYVQIFEKNCKLIVGRQKRAKFNKLGKRLGTGLFEADYTQNEKIQILSMDPLLNMLKSDYELKFYNIKLVQMQQQDLQSIIKQLSCSTSQKIKNSIGHRQIHQLSKYKTWQIPKYKSDVLVQTGLDTKINKQQPINYFNIQKEQQNQGFNIDQIESKQIKKIKQRFNKNIKKFTKIFKLQNNQFQA